MLATTSIIAVCSVCALCCSLHVTRSGRLPAGATGMAVAVAAALLLISGMWLELHSEPYWKATAIACIFALAFSHSLALLAIRLESPHHRLQAAATVTIFALAGLASLMILGEIDNEGFFKLLAVLGILAALETLVIPILARPARTRPGRPALRLVPAEDGLYRDDQGRRYRVDPVTGPPGAG